MTKQTNVGHGISQDKLARQWTVLGNPGRLVTSSSYYILSWTLCIYNKLCGRPPQYAPAPCKLTFDLLTLKVVSESRVTWATSVRGPFQAKPK